MNWAGMNPTRKALIAAAGAGLLLAAIAASAIQLRPRRAQLSSFQGTVMDPAWKAEDFSLLDQHGDRFRLQEARAKVVVLTFLYTSCTDVCPFIGAKLRNVSEELGPRRDAVEFVVISTDPKRDTPERVAEYSRILGMYERWHYLIGREEELRPLWEAYFVGTERSEENGEGVSDETLREYGLLNGLSVDDVTSAKQAIQAFGGGYDVSHSTPVWLIDRRGQVRTLHGQDLLPSELLHDIMLLLEEAHATGAGAVRHQGAIASSPSK